MRIFYDCIVFELQKAGGISVYWSALLERSRLESVITFGRENSNIFSGNILTSIQSEVYPSFIPRRYLPFICKPSTSNNSKHVFHSSYFRYSNDRNSINVTTVHDFTYEHFVRGPRLWVHSWQKRLAVKKSKGIICVSENTKKTCCIFIPGLILKLSKLFITVWGRNFIQ